MLNLLNLILKIAVFEVIIIINKFQVKVALRSVLNELDEETEILPHIKAAKDFEIYEPVTLQPFFTILPWDENTKPNYEVFFKVKKKL